MNPSKVEEGLFHHHLDPIAAPEPLILDHNHHEEEPPPPLEFCLPPLSEFDLFRDDNEEDSISRTSSDADGVPPATNNTDVSSQKTNPRLEYVDPEPHISSQFYTFNIESHSLMIRCILEGRLANPDEIRAATPQATLGSWRSVWKDRNEDTAYLTAWKRIQDKLTVHRGQHGNEFLCSKNNSNNQFVSHTSQWQDIVMNFHGDADLKHIRACVAACPVCSDSNASGGARSKRRRFEYTESFDVPFMAEVKDYACHRAGEPASSSKKSRILKREPYASKRCGCGFRIRAIVPISNYNEKDKTFVYQEEGMAVFKLYAVHSGHEPGPLDGNARIMHRIVGHKGGLLLEQDLVYGMTEEPFMTKNNDNMQHTVLQQVKELKNEVNLLESKITKMPPDLLPSVSQELFDMINKVRNIGEYGSKSLGILSDTDLVDWSGHQIEDDDDSFERTLGDVGSWDDTCKPEKWLKCNGFDEDSKITKPVRHDETDLQVDSFYPENSKWYDSPCGLDPGMECGGNGFRHGEIV